MTTRLFATVFAFVAVCGSLHAGDSTTAQGLAVLDEKVSRLSAQMEDLQVRYQQTQKDLDKINGELQELRRVAATGGGVSQADLKAIDDRIQAVDNARQKDRQAIIDQLAKELAGAGKSTGKPTPPADAKEHVVAKGETLSSIAKTYKVNVEELKKANNLSGNDIKVGQKLTIPK